MPPASEIEICDAPRGTYSGAVCLAGTGPETLSRLGVSDRENEEFRSVERDVDLAVGKRVSEREIVGVERSGLLRGHVCGVALQFIGDGGLDLGAGPGPGRSEP